MRPRLVDAGIDKLEDFLLAMAPGDQVSTRRAAEISGLDHKQCAQVLDALMRTGLIMRLQHDAYVRCPLELRDQQPA